MMDNELNTQYICAFHEINDEELDVEKNILEKYNKEDNKLNINFKNIYYPIFQYERIRLPNSGNGNLPYGECFTTAFNSNATYLACGYSNGHVNIFNLIEKKEPIKFKVSDYPVTSIKWNEKKKSNNNNRMCRWYCVSLSYSYWEKNSFNIRRKKFNKRNRLFL